MKFRKCFSALLIFSQLLCVSSYYNYIVNGDFEQPVTAQGTFSTVVTGWNGTNFNLWNIFVCAGFSGQCMDLQAFENQNGNISQSVSLAQDSYCNLSFYQKAYTANYSWYILEVYWNSQLVSTHTANTTIPTFQSVVLDGVVGDNTLMFNEIGDSVGDGLGMLIDNVSLTLVMIVLVVWESNTEAFVSKVFYCLELIYCSLFILLNFSLYFGYAANSIYFDEGLKQMALGLQEIVIYLLLSIALVLLFFDFVPLTWLKKSTFMQLLIKNGYKPDKKWRKQKKKLKVKQGRRQRKQAYLKEVNQLKKLNLKTQPKIEPSNHQKPKKQQIFPGSKQYFRDYYQANQQNKQSIQASEPKSRRKICKLKEKASQLQIVSK